jgi:hypothetical protein
MNLNLNRNFEIDYLFGQKSELELLNLLQNYFNDKKLQLTDRYAKFDLESDKINIEIKSRKFTADKYKTTLVPYNKCILINNKKTYIVINFIDSVYFIEYLEDKFKKYEIKNFSRQQQQEFDLPYYYISLSEFTKICDK